MKTCLLLLSILLSACTGASDTTDKTTEKPTEKAAAPSISALPTQTLQRYHWQLSDAVDGDSQRIDALFGDAGKPLQLDFNEKRVNVSNACNGISGDYHVVEDHLVTKLLMQTMMACPDSTLQQRETIIKRVLQGEPSLILSKKSGAPQLVLVAADGRTLTFTGAATAQSRHPGPVATMFLEVAAQTAPCTASGSEDKPCLRVRERHYDNNGLRSGSPGPWHVLQQPIEGFTAQADVHYVLRVQRYTGQSSEDTAPAYVLDTIVESGRAPASD